MVTKLFAGMDLPLFVKWKPSSQRWLVVICWWYMNSKSFLKHRFFNSLLIFSMSIDVLSDGSIDDTNTLLILWFLHELAIFRISSGNKRISIKRYSILRSFSWIANYDFVEEEITNYYRENFKTAGNLKIIQISSGGGVINNEISHLGIPWNFPSKRS